MKKIMKKFNKKAALTGMSPWIMGLMIVILFSFLIIGFSINFIGTTNPTSDIFTIYGFNASYNNLNNSLASFTSIANDVYGVMGQSQPSATEYLFLIFRGAFSIPFAFLGFILSGIIAIIGLLLSLVMSTTGMSVPIVAAMSVLFAGLLITAIFLIIKSIRTGENFR